MHVRMYKAIEIVKFQKEVFVVASAALLLRSDVIRKSREQRVITRRDAYAWQHIQNYILVLVVYACFIWLTRYH